MISIAKLYNVADMIGILNAKGKDLSDCKESIDDLMQQLSQYRHPDVINTVNAKLLSLAKILSNLCTLDPLNEERIKEIPLYKASQPVEGRSFFSSLPSELIIKILEQSGEALRVFKTCSVVSTSFKAAVDADSFWSNLCNKEIPNLMKIKGPNVKLKEYYKNIMDITQFKGNEGIQLRCGEVILNVRLNTKHLLIRAIHLKKLVLSQYPYPSIVNKFLDNTILLRSGNQAANEDFVNALTTTRDGQPYCMTGGTDILVMPLEPKVIETILPNPFFCCLDRVWIKHPDGKKYSIGLDTSSKNLTVDRIKQILEDQHNNLQGQLNDYELVRAGVVGKGPDLVNNLGTKSMYLLNDEELQLIKNDTALNTGNNTMMQRFKIWRLFQYLYRYLKGE